MIHTIIQKNNYQDSIVLMLLTNNISTLDGVNRVSIMMGTPANKDIFKTGGLYTEDLEKATANDMAIVLDINDDSIIDSVMEKINEFLEQQAAGVEQNETMQVVKNWDKATKAAKNTEVALISIPGIYAASEIERALDEDYNVFCFSDNVSIEDEKRLKEKAHEKGLLLMGPDCGTGIINGIPLAFTNVIREGKIGIVGASGTGIQEVSTLIDKLGEGVTHAIGTGGRDLKEEIGGITFMDSIALLAEDANTEVIVAISKPAAKEVKEKVLAQLRSLGKPAVTLFLGELPYEHEDNLYHAYTLEEAARLAVTLARKEEIKELKHELREKEIKLSASQKYIKAYYSGGTLASEAAMMLKQALKLKDKNTSKEGYTLKYEGYEIIDLGDDMYTQGKPHPMIDPENRIAKLKEVSSDKETGVVLLDFVLGYGSHENMAEELIPTIKEIKEDAKKEGRELAIIATVVGTTQDPQNYTNQINLLKEAGVIIKESNAEAVRYALELIDAPLPNIVREKISEKRKEQANKVSDKMRAMLSSKEFLNIGLRSFAQAIEETGGNVVQFDWKPVAGGNVELQKALAFLRTYKN